MKLATVKELQNKSLELRKNTLQMIHDAKTGHTGSDLSCADILTVLYYRVLNNHPDNPKDPDRDRYVQSKGHAVEILWNILANQGYFDKSELTTFSQYGSRLIGHPNNKVPGIEMNTGSLGHGLSVAVGMAIAAKLDKKSYQTYVLMGDGELAEGSVWEGAMAAAHYKLDNLTAIIDRNKLQITGKQKDVMNIEPLAEKWQSFGWEVVEVKGNDIAELLEAFNLEHPDKPKVIIAHTTKGNGVSFMADRANWHHKVPSEEELQQAFEELDLQMEELRHE